MMITYISQLQLRLRTFNLENIKLLDGMHEGLLILSTKNKKVMFCNKPSQKLLKGVLQTQEQTENTEESSRLLGQQVFNPLNLITKEPKSTGQLGTRAPEHGIGEK